MPRVQGVTLSLRRLRVRGVFRIAYGSWREAETLYARVELSDGTVGWGEAAPAPRVTGEYPEAGLAAGRMAAGKLIGVDVERLGELLDRLTVLLRGYPAARAAIANALLDAYARLHGAPLCDLVGGCRGMGGSETLVTVSLGEPWEMAERASELVSRGFRMLKVKLGGPVGLDVERVRAVREAVGEGVVVTVDANQAWSHWDALRALEELEKLGVVLVEQPLPAHDLEALAKLSSVSPVPIAVDESVLTLRDLVALHRLGFRGYVNIKVSRVGGVDVAARMGIVARELGLETMTGCMLESSLAIAAALHASSVYKPSVLDLDAPLLLEEDPAGCRVYAEPPRLAEPRGPGVGCEPRLAV